jgi:asparagine synthase (glutamine-hydrolysing)
MCGIVGTAQVDRRFSVEDVRRMTGRIVHRGPDDEGIYDGGSVVLGMRRLSIIDLSGGHQPISNEDETIWVVCNGEIYNFRELRKSLESLGHKFRTHSDTETIVHLYEEYGEEFVSRLEGMFGFALWDSVRKKLLIARDRLGIKPIYYWHHANGLAFASEIKALTVLPGFSTQIDTASLNDYLAVGYATAPRTIFASVQKLPPASVLIWHEGRLSGRRYWDLPHTVDRRRTLSEWTERIRSELERSVAAQMVSDVPLGAFLSGGIDSSVVAVLMARQSREPLNTYSIGYAGTAAARYYNELPFARVVANRLASNHRQIEVRPDVTRLLPKLVWHMEEPICDSAIMTTYLVSELAAQSVKVILSGVGGDELFAGYNRYLGAHYGRAYSKVPEWVRSRLLPRLAGLLPSGRQNRLMDFARYSKRFIRAGGLDWRQQYRFYVALAERETLANLPRHAPETVDSFERVLAGETADDDLLRLLRVDWQTQLSEDLLLLTDKMTMACSIECRVPFLDERLVELAASIPAEHKLPGGRLKGLLKTALDGVLPEEIILRRKRGFGAPVGSWLKRELAPLRATLLSPEVVEARGLLDPAAVQSVCAAHDGNREDYSDLLLVLLNLEIWCRLYLDGTSHEDVSTELSERSLAA